MYDQEKKEQEWKNLVLASVQQEKKCEAEQEKIIWVDSFWEKPLEK